MSEKIIVDVNKVREYINYKKGRNAEKMENLDFQIDGKSVFIPDKIREEWGYTGLNTFSFVEEFLMDKDTVDIETIWDTQKE